MGGDAGHRKSLQDEKDKGFDEALFL